MKIVWENFCSEQQTFTCALHLFAVYVIYACITRAGKICVDYLFNANVFCCVPHQQHQQNSLKVNLFFFFAN